MLDPVSSGLLISEERGRVVRLCLDAPALCWRWPLQPDLGCLLVDFSHLLCDAQFLSNVDISDCQKAVERRLAGWLRSQHDSAHKLVSLAAGLWDFSLVQTTSLRESSVTFEAPVQTLRRFRATSASSVFLRRTACCFACRASRRCT